MWALTIPDAFNCNDVFPINTHQRGEASIDGCMVDLASGGIVLGDNYSTGTATAFCAPELCASEADATQVFKKCDLGVDAIKLDLCAIEVET